MNLGSPWSQEATQLWQQPWSPPVLILQGILFAEPLAERTQRVIILSVGTNCKLAGPHSLTPAAGLGGT